VLSISTAALALLTLQTMAPSGGAGHRTSLRGGGPLSTLILPKAPSTLWHRLWANVPSSDRPATLEELPRIFPWLGPTRLSDKDRVTTPDDVDWRQAFFGMPRRIRLNVEPNVDRLPCDLTGEIEDVIVRTYRTLKHGVNYEAWGGVHPLTPHYRAKPTAPVRNPVHGEDGRMGYRQWVAMLYGDKDGLREPAKCVSFFIQDRKDDLPPNERSFRLTAAGYAMDNMKALAFVEAETPDLTIADAEEQVEQKCKDFVAAANNVAVALGRAVKLARYGEDAGIKIESTPLAVVRDRFWSATNDQFFAILNDLSALAAEAFVGEAISRRWLSVLERAALAIFDDVAPIQDILLRNFATKNGTVKNWLVEGRRQLVSMLRGYGPRGVELFKNLQLPVPETKKKRSKHHDHPERSADGMGTDRPTLVG
jgi:CRISPR system Cascade subunit CasA